MDIRKRLLLSGMGCFLCFGVMTVLNVLLLPFSSECHGYARFPLFFVFAVCFALFLILGRTVRQISDADIRKMLKIAKPAYIVCLLVLQIALGYALEYTPSGDNALLYNGAKMLADGVEIRSNAFYYEYYSHFSNQFGFLILLYGLRSMLLSLGITAFFLPQVIVQAMLYALAVHALTITATKLSGYKSEFLLLILLAACFPVYLAAGVLYTDTYSAPFIAFVLCFAIQAQQAESKKKQIIFAFLAGLCAMIGGPIKMTVFIMLMAVGIVWALTMKPARAALCIGLCALMALGSMSVAKQYVLSHDIVSETDYNQHNTPAIHWVMMSIPSSDNPYGTLSNDYGITWNMMKEGATKQEIMSSILSRMKDKIYTLRYPDRFFKAMMRKNGNAFGDGTFGMTEMLDDGPVRRNAISEIVLEDGRYYMAYKTICTGGYLAIFALALLSCLRDIREKDVKAAIPTIAMFGIMLFLMLWEARSRYFFGFVPVLLLLAARSLSKGACKREFHEQAKS